MWPNAQSPADLVTFTEEILNGKLHFLCSESKSFWRFFSIFIVDFEYGFFCCKYRGIMSTPNRRYIFNINKKNTRTMLFHIYFNPLSANFTKWSNTLKQFVGHFPTNYLSVFNHFVKLALKGLRISSVNVNLLKT